MAYESPLSIAEAAEQCFHVFQRCSQLSSSIPPREFSLVENQMARFSIWTSNNAVFAPTRASMDHRVREAPEIQELVKALLDALYYHGQNCLSCLESLSKGRLDAPDDHQSIFEKVEQSTLAAGKDISLLHKLSNTIRKASNESQNQKAAASFNIRDDEGHDVETFLTTIFAKYIQDRFSGVSEKLRDRLATTMLLRRKRVLYRRSRHEKNPIKLPTARSHPLIEAPQAQSENENSDQTVQNEQAPAKSVVQSSLHSRTVMSAITLSLSQYKKVSAQSVASESKTIALQQHEELNFPCGPIAHIKRKYKEIQNTHYERHKAFLSQVYADLRDLGVRYPIEDSLLYQTEQQKDEAKMKDATAIEWEECLRTMPEITCPYCFHALPANQVSDDEKWKCHLRKDLDPYVCLFEECDTPEELFSHSSAWIEHMKLHKLRWQCNAKSHGLKLFYSKDKYLEHMKADHSSSLTDAKLSILADRSVRKIGSVFQSCPLCGLTETNDANLEVHIVGHLRLLALKSLPSFHENQDQHYSSSASGGSRQINISSSKMITTSSRMGSVSPGSIQDPDFYNTTFRTLVYSPEFPTLPGSRGVEWGTIIETIHPDESLENDDLIQGLISSYASQTVTVALTDSKSYPEGVDPREMKSLSSLVGKFKNEPSKEGYYTIPYRPVEPYSPEDVFVVSAQEEFLRAQMMKHTHVQISKREWDALERKVQQTDATDDQRNIEGFSRNDSELPSTFSLEHENADKDVHVKLSQTNRGKSPESSDDSRNPSKFEDGYSTGVYTTDPVVEHKASWQDVDDGYQEAQDLNDHKHPTSSSDISNHSDKMIIERTPRHISRDKPRRIIYTTREGEARESLNHGSLYVSSEARERSSRAGRYGLYVPVDDRVENRFSRGERGRRAKEAQDLNDHEHPTSNSDISYDPDYIIVERTPRDTLRGQPRQIYHMPREGEARTSSSRGSLYASSTKAVHRWGVREAGTHSSEEDVTSEVFQESDDHKRPSSKTDNSSPFIEGDPFPGQTLPRPYDSNIVENSEAQEDGPRHRSRSQSSMKGVSLRRDRRVVIYQPKARPDEMNTGSDNEGNYSQELRLYDRKSTGDRNAVSSYSRPHKSVPGDDREENRFSQEELDRRARGRRYQNYYR